MYAFRTIASHTLRSLTFVVEHQDHSRHNTLVLAAPRLASLRLVLPFGSHAFPHGYPVAADPEAMASVVRASICIEDMDSQRSKRVKRHKLVFLKATCKFLARLHNVTNLDLSGFTTTALQDQETQEFPMLHNVRNLILKECGVGVSFQALTSILRNTPNLERLELFNCKFLDLVKRRSGKAAKKSKSSKKCGGPTLHDYKNLKSIEIKCQRDEEDHLEKVLTEISSGKPEELQLSQWNRVQRLGRGYSTIDYCFELTRPKGR